MIRLGDSEFWLESGAGGWLLLRVDGKGRGRRTQAFGPYSSPRHALQQRQVKLSDVARLALGDLAEAMEAGEAAVEDLPPLPEKNLMP